MFDSNYYNEIVSNFIEDAKKRKFSDSLTNSCIEVLRRSYIEGDGGLWTNSLFIYLTEHNLSNVSEKFNFFTGLRGDILINDYSFTKTLTPQLLTFNTTFQSPIDELIKDFNIENPKKIIDEETLIKLELKYAIDDIGEQYRILWSFVDDLVRPFEVGPIIDRKYGHYDLFRTQLYRAFLLSFISKVHPFTIFKNATHPYNIPYRKENNQRECFNFLVRIRDSKRISEERLSLKLLEEISKRWDEFNFQSAVGYMELEISNIDFMNEYNAHCLYTAELITKFGGSIELLLEELNASKEEANFKHNEGLLIYLHNQRISVSPIDQLGNRIVKHSNDLLIQKNNLGILTTNPIWNPSVIENFEYLLNKDYINEWEFQKFFEIYPDFILDELHISAIPQITLINEFSQKKLRPDFILRRSDSNFVDILEIKKPIRHKLFSGGKNREVPTLELLYYIRQLQEYKNYFQSEANRNEFIRKYGLDGFEPVISLLIGRRNSFGNPEVLKRIVQGQNVNILTYDNILDMIKMRVSRSLMI